MKFVNGRMGLACRFSAVFAALLLGQQAMAAGTKAGTEVENTATINYDVGTTAQPAIDSNTVKFVVDRRVNFTLLPLSTPDLEPVNPGENEAWVDFELTNLSNSPLDFLLAVAQVSGVDVDGQGNDTADLSDLKWAVVTTGDPTPTQGGAQIVDELAADDSARIRVWGDAAVTLTDGLIAGVELTATAKLAGAAGLGGDLTYGASDGVLTVENVDVDSAGGVRVSIDGFIVESEVITVTKASAVVGGGPAIPGATIEYTITIVSGATSAEASNVAITDSLDTELEVVTGSFSGSDFEIDNGGAVSVCSAAVDGDDCELVASLLTFDNLTIAQGATLVVTYRVTIRGTGPTGP